MILIRILNKFDHIILDDLSEIISDYLVIKVYVNRLKKKEINMYTDKLVQMIPVFWCNWYLWKLITKANNN